MQPGGTEDFLIQLVPLMIFWIIFMIIGIPIARRKGIGTFGIVIGCVPFWSRGDLLGELDRQGYP